MKHSHISSQHPNSTRRMKAQNKSGTITYIVSTGDQKSKEDPNLENLKVRIEQEKVVSILENILHTAKDIDYSTLDELNSADNPSAYAFMSFLNSVEILASHWKLINKDKYLYRTMNHGQLDAYINELPRSQAEGKIFSIQTFVLSCKTPYMKTKDGSKIFISKEYSNAAGKLHLHFCLLLDLVVRELSAKLAESRQRQNSVFAFFRTMFSGGQEGVVHPLFKETGLIKRVKRQVKMVELSIRNFE